MNSVPESLWAHCVKMAVADVIEHYEGERAAADGDVVVTIVRKKERSMVRLMVVEMQLLVVIPCVGSSGIEPG